VERSPSCRCRTYRHTAPHPPFSGGRDEEQDPPAHDEQKQANLCSCDRVVCPYLLLDPSEGRKELSALRVQHDKRMSQAVVEEHETEDEEEETLNNGEQKPSRAREEEDDQEGKQDSRHEVKDEDGEDEGGEGARDDVGEAGKRTKTLAVTVTTRTKRIVTPEDGCRILGLISAKDFSQPCPLEA
jgi:hypothetical protein